MNLSEFSIRRSVFAWMIMFSAIVFGAVSLNRLGVSYLPDVDFPVLNVSVNWEGTVPAIMETEIAERLEKELVNVEGLTEIKSSIRQGRVSIALTFEINRNIDVALQEVQSYLSQVRLPTDVDPPRIMKSNPEDQPILWLGLSGDRSIRDLFVFTDNSLIDRIKLLPGVGEVIIGGAGERSLRINVDNNKLKRYQLTILDVKNAIAMQHVEAASGYFENSITETNLRIMGEGLTPEQVSKIVITRRGGEPVVDTVIRISDVAEVEDGMNDLRRVNSIGGVPGISIGVKKQRGTNAIDVGHRVLREVDEINKILPEDMKLRPLFNGVKFAEQAVDDTEIALLLAVLITTLVVYGFLGSFSSTLNIFLAIPTSVMGTFIILYFSGFTLNLFTLLALSLAIGIVVDDAIMILENIVRHFDMGKDPYRASIDGSREVFFAALATTAVLLSIFIPVIFMKGIIGKFFFQFGVTISGAVALSTLDALTLTPMRASRTLRREPEGSKKGILKTIHYLIASVLGRFEKWYEKKLVLALQRKTQVIIFSVVVFAASLLWARALPSEFVPSQDQSQFGISVKYPAGTSLENTREKVAAIEGYLQNQPEVKEYIAIVGGFGGGETNGARLILSLVPPSERSLNQEMLMEKWKEELKPVAKTRVAMFDFAARGLSPRGSAPVELIIQGPSWDELQRVALKSIEQMEETGLMNSIDLDYQEGMPEVQLIPDRQQAALRGVSVSQLYDTIRTAIGGVREGRFTGDSKRYDIRIRLKNGQREKAADLERIDVRNSYGELLPVTSIALIKEDKSVSTLSRIDRQRSISITARMAPGSSQAEAIKVSENIVRENLAEGYSVKQGGSTRGFSESIGSLAFALILGVFTAYIALAIQFNSFIYPLVILVALPFGAAGAIWSLNIFGQSLNLFSMIGIILLGGLVTKNSIMIVEFINQYRSRGLGLREAVLTAAPLRLRPIIMTSITTIAAALPQALPIGSGWETRVPMSLTVIGGILVSMSFSLFVVPVVYELLARFELRRPQIDSGGSHITGREIDRHDQNEPVGRSWVNTPVPRKNAGEKKIKRSTEVKSQVKKPAKKTGKKEQKPGSKKK